MPRHIIFNTSTRAILAIDPQMDPYTGAILPVGVPCAAATISDTEAAKILAGTGVYSLDPDGTTVLVAAPAAPDPAVTTAMTERSQSLGDLSTLYAAADTRLSDIITNGGSYTGAQVRDATVDLARIQRRIMRALRTLAPVV